MGRSIRAASFTVVSLLGLTCGGRSELEVTAGSTTGAASSSASGGPGGAGGAGGAGGSGGAPCAPVPEVCDGIDNDCNGLVDDGNPGGGVACATGQPGVCAAGTTACTGGAVVCVPDQAPSVEICDGLDNDCNGTVDDLCLTWSLRFGDFYDDRVQDLAVDGAGHVFVTGFFNGVVDFGTGAIQGPVQITTAGAAFAVEYDPAGSAVWAQAFLGSVTATPTGQGTGIALDGAGEVALIGDFQGDIDLGAGLLDQGGETVFVARLDAAHHVVLAEALGLGRGGGIEVGAPGELLLTEQASQSSVVVALDPGGTPLFTRPACAVAAGSVAAGAAGSVLLGGPDCLLTYTSAGAPAFAQTWGAALTGVAVDGAGNLVVAGTFAGTLDLGGGSLGVSPGSSILLAKLDPAGKLIFAEAFPVPGIYTPTLITVAVGASGDLVIAGNVAAGADFGGGPLPGAGYGVSVATFDPEGHHRSSHGYYAADGEAFPVRVRLDVSGHVVLGGYFYGTVDFGDGPLTSQGNDDGFVARLAP